MKLELLVPRVTLRGAEMPGDIIDAPQAEAERLIAAGHARPVRRGRKPEKATPADKAEKAVR